MISNKDKKYIKSLQIKKYRQQHQAFLVEGWKSVSELLDSDFEIELLFINEKYSSICNGVITSESDINSVSSLHNNKDAIAVVKIPKTETKFENQPIFIFDGIQDPGNLGTIIRTADWLGLSNIVCSTDSVDFYNPKVISSTKGSFLRIQPKYLDIEKIIKESKSNIYLADLDGQDFKNIEITTRDIIVFGGESQGIKQNLRNIIRNKISIQKRGGAESLNVAMSFGIIAAHI